MRTYYKPGSWNCLCDRCGLQYKSDALIKEWTGLMVCAPCWEPRHPQDLLRVPKEQISVPWSRPEPDDTFVTYVCYLWESGGYADLGGADCCQADNQSQTYQFLYDLKNGT